MVLAVQLLLTFISGSFAVIIYYGGHGSIWRLLAALAGYSFLTAITRSGWLVPCVIIGVLVGLLSDAPIKLGNLEYQFSETIRHIVGGTVLGLIAGFTCDAIAASNKPTSSSEPIPATPTAVAAIDE